MARNSAQRKFDTSGVLGDFDSGSPHKDLNSALLRLVRENPDKEGHWQVKLSELIGGDDIANADRDEQARIVDALTGHLLRIDRIVRQYRELDRKNYNLHRDPTWKEIWGPRTVLFSAIHDLLRKKLPLTPKQVSNLAAWVASVGEKNVYSVTYTHPLSGVVKAIENANNMAPLDKITLQPVRQVVTMLKAQRDGRELRKYVDRLEKVLGLEPALKLDDGEAWSDAVRADFGSMEKTLRLNWKALLAHCPTASQGKPNKKWLDLAAELLKAVGNKEFTARMERWLPLVDRPRTKVIESWSEWAPNPNLMLSDRNVDMLKGIVWCCSMLEDASVSRLLTALAISAYRKVPGIGPRAVKVGNACVYALGAMPGTEGVAQLAILKVRVKFKTAQKGIEKALVATAERVGIPREELEEMSVPTYGLTDIGGKRGSGYFLIPAVGWPIFIPWQEDQESRWETFAITF